MIKEKPILLIGFGGHAKVLINILSLLGREIIGALSLEPIGTEYLSIKVVGSDENLWQYDPKNIQLVNAIGQLPKNDLRAQIYLDAKAKGFSFANVIHPNAIIAQNVIFGEGVQVMAGAIIEPSVKIFDNVIVNTGANINHDVRIHSHTHVAPGAVVCGDVVIGSHVFIGAAACIVPGVRISDNAFVRANELVCKLK
jgi:sugar O-acyltransferase (sialic acid O-acetyltransferase NeuD family)